MRTETNTESSTRTRAPWLIALAVPAFALATAGTALTLGGCNTTAGLGEDIEAGGDALEDAAEDAND